MKRMAFFLIILLPLHALSSFTDSESTRQVDSSFNYTPHDPIEITNDSQLATVAVRGTGSQVAPYILEDWSISTSGTMGIAIYNTTQHFIIRNCWITGDGQATGIMVENAKEGTTTVTSNHCENNSVGITLIFSNSSTITNNTCQANSCGIFIGKCCSSIVTDNHCENNSQGLSIYGSDSSVFVNNTCNRNHLGFWLHDRSDSTIVANNTCNENSRESLTIEESDCCEITGNICQENRRGIVIHASSKCSIISNFLIENDVYGVALGLKPPYHCPTNYPSDNNIVHHNWFINNSFNWLQAYDNGTDN